MTYNVHACIGLDGKHMPARIGSIIAAEGPDIVALQEVDVGRPRTAHSDHARELAEILSMEYHFHPSFCIEDGKYGNALLSRLPMRLLRAGELPRYAACERRGALLVGVGVAGGEIFVLNTHLGLRRPEQLMQARALLGRDWLAAADEGRPLILCGDMNFGPRSAVYRMFRKAALVDAHGARSGRERLPTWMGLRRIDYIFVSSRLGVESLYTPGSAKIRVASDHVPLVADICHQK